MPNIFQGFDYADNKIKISRNIFPYKPTRNTTLNLGEVTPLLCFETIPGSTYDFNNIDLQTFLTSPLKHPMLSDVYQDVHIFYCPMRIIWKDYTAFEGSPEPSAWNEAPQGNYTIPMLDYSLTPCQRGDIGHNMGITPIGFTGRVSQLPFRAFAKIYNYFYRDQNVEYSQNTYYDNENSVIFRQDIFSQGNAFLENVLNSKKFPLTNEAFGAYTPDNANLNAIALGGLCPHAYKLRDFYQSLLPRAQKGEPVTVSLTGEAPVIGSDSLHSLGSNGYHLGSSSASFSENNKLYFSDFSSLPLASTSGATNGYYFGINSSNGSLSNLVSQANLVADLQNTSVITIDQLETAIALQRVMRRSAVFGTRYSEILKSVFKEFVPDFRIDEPECIGGFRRKLNISTVVQSSNGGEAASPTGSLYGFSTTNLGKNNINQFTAKERGYIIVCTVIRTDNVYSQGVNEAFTRSTRFEFGRPDLANLPDEGVSTRNLYWSEDLDTNGYNILGFGERYGFYRFLENRNAGMLDPNGDDVVNALPNWTAQELLSSEPTLTTQWKKSIGYYLDRCLQYPHFVLNDGVVTDIGPDQFITSAFFDINARLPLPIHPKIYTL